MVFWLALGFLVGPKIASEGNALATSLPSLLNQAGSGQLVSQVGQKHGWSEARQAQIQNFFITHKDNILGYGRAIGQKLAAPAQHIWWVILIPILGIFFLKDGRSIGENLVAMGRAPEERKTLRGIVGDVNVMLGSYIRAQLILASLTLVVYTVGLSILHLRYALHSRPSGGHVRVCPSGGPGDCRASLSS